MPQEGTPPFGADTLPPDHPPTLLLSRHPGARNWLADEAQRRGWQPAHMVAHLEAADIGHACRVAGTMPLLLMVRLLAAGVEVWHLHLPQAGLQQRGVEHSSDAMRVQGARLVRVRHIDIEEQD